MKCLLALALACGSTDPAVPPKPAPPAPKPAPPPIDAAKRDDYDFACPSAVAGAVTTVADVDGGVAVTVTGRDVATAGEIRARVADHFLLTCSMAMEPDGWADDDCFQGDAQKRCPIMARTADVTVTEVEGGVTIKMLPAHADKLAHLRTEIRARANQFR